LQIICTVFLVSKYGTVDHDEGRVRKKDKKKKINERKK
jgi:hypothetical protein